MQIGFVVREFESSQPSPPFPVYGDWGDLGKSARISGGLRAESISEIGDQGKTGRLGLFARAVSNADFRISEFRAALNCDRVLCRVAGGASGEAASFRSGDRADLLALSRTSAACGQVG
jgi:hypothetical protein